MKSQVNSLFLLVFTLKKYLKIVQADEIQILDTFAQDFFWVPQHEKLDDEWRSSHGWKDRVHMVIFYSKSSFSFYLSPFLSLVQRYQTFFILLSGKVLWSSMYMYSCSYPIQGTYIYFPFHTIHRLGIPSSTLTSLPYFRFPVTYMISDEQNEGESQKEKLKNWKVKVQWNSDCEEMVS